MYLMQQQQQMRLGSRSTAARVMAHAPMSPVLAAGLPSSRAAVCAHAKVGLGWGGHARNEWVLAWEPHTHTLVPRSRAPATGAAATGAAGRLQ